MAETPETPTPPEDTPQAREPEVPVVPPIDPYASRFDRLERQLSALTGQMLSITQAQPAPAAKEDLKDEELWSLAQQGNRQAFEMYMERIAERKARVINTASEQDRTVTQQLSILYQKYPELSDPQNPLTQRAVQFKAALVAMGSPNTRDTDLNAILRAVADSRDLLSAKTTQPVRTPAPGQIGVSHQQVPSQPTPGAQPSHEEIELAKRYGVKDIAKAKERFQARQNEGRSAVSPTIALLVKDQ